MNNSSSLFWYDYETFGVDPRRDRPAQFAAIRTNLDLEPVGEPLNLYCRLSNDYLPHPEACLITGITPQKANAEGLPETEFIGRIRHELAQPNTVLVGYNNIRFDDEVTRFSLYRNFFDAYGHEWQNGNSRWDILDVLRLTHALRPQGIHWPKHEDGATSFRLDQLTVANGIEHGSAHDALADVRATIAMAKLIRQHQPKLYEFVFENRTKQKIASLLNLSNPNPVLHVSAMYPASLGCIALVFPLVQHPVNKNEIIVYDLRVNPEPFLDLSVDDLKMRLFTRKEDLPEGVERLPIKSVHINKCPIVVPVSTLTREAAEQWNIDPEKARQHQRQLQAVGKFRANIQELYRHNRYEPNHDPDFMLYDGGFFSRDDRAAMDAIHDYSAHDLATISPAFKDSRLHEMYFRYRARNFPATLNEDELSIWNEFRRVRLIDDSDGSGLTFVEFEASIKLLQSDKNLNSGQIQILNDLQEYAQTLESTLSES